MNAERFLVVLIAILAGADVVLLFVALNAWSDRNRLARRLQRLLDNQRGGAHG